MTNTESQRFAKYQMRELSGHKKKIGVLSWSPNGRRLASGSHDSGIRIWLLEPHCQVAKGERAESELKGHNDYISAMQWKPSALDVLASLGGEKDRSLRFWDTRTGKLTNTINLPSGFNVSLAWSPDGGSLAVANNKDCTICIVDTRKNKVARTFQLDASPYHLAWGYPTVGQIMCSSSDGCVHVHSATDMSLLWSLKGHRNSCYCFALDRENERLVTGGGDALVSVWDLDSAVCLRTFTRADMPVKDMSLTRDGQYLAYASEAPPPLDGSLPQHRGVLEVVSMKTGELCYSAALKGPLDSVQWNPEYPVLAYHDERDDMDSQGRSGRERLGVICIFAPPKS